MDKGVAANEPASPLTDEATAKALAPVAATSAVSVPSAKACFEAAPAAKRSPSGQLGKSARSTSDFQPSA